MKNLTPDEMRCTWGACPAVYELDENAIVIVGAKPDADVMRVLNDAGVACDENEQIVVVEKRLLANVVDLTAKTE